jgi:AraC-like DNA-binding protein
MLRANQAIDVERENRRAALLHDPASCCGRVSIERVTGALICTFLPMRSTTREPTCATSGSTDALLAELRARIIRHACRDETTAIDGVLLSTADAPGEPRASTSGTVLAVIAQGAKRLAIGDRVYDYGAGQYLVASVDLPITGHYSRATAAEPALGFGLVLRPPVIASLILDDLGASSAGPPPPGHGGAAPPGLGVADASPELLDAIVRLVGLLDSPSDQHVLAPMLEREILWRLITGPLGRSVRQIGLADSSLTHISRAVRWITDHYGKPFRVEELARTCGMSTSAFHRNFHAVTALSPIQFQKQIRLQRSRLLLMTGEHDVATVAYRVGYDSPSQFSREYRRQFGSPPGRDAVRLRDAVGAR